MLGKPPQKFIDAEKAVLEGMEAGLDMAREGNLCEDIAIAFFEVLRKYDIITDNRTSYPIGLSYPPDWGERPCSLRPGDRTILQKGMTFHFMTGLWMDDMGFEITESIATTPTRIWSPGQIAAPTKVMLSSTKSVSVYCVSPEGPAGEWGSISREKKILSGAL